jgi:NADPH:quinone reductase-like Zn-dependent oxidoreductase
MKAYVVDKYGKDSLHVAELPEPKVGSQEVLVRVSAASINPLDKLIRDGEFKQLIKYKRPFVLGHDVSGVVVGVGSAVTDFGIGDEIYARPRDLHIGTFAQLIAIHHEDVALKPATLSLEEAAAVPLVALAARQLLVERAQIKPGQKVLVHAGAGGLGSTVIQLAKHLGAKVATTTDTQTVDLVRSLGADIVVDFTQEDFSQLLGDFDLVIDSVGGKNLEKSLTVLKPGGLAISVVGPPDAGFAKQLGAPSPLGLVMNTLSRKIRAKAKKRGVRYEFFFMRASGVQLRELGALYDRGALRPVIDKVFGFEQTLEAMSYVERGRTTAGKVVVSHRTLTEENR